MKFVEMQIMLIVSELKGKGEQVIKEEKGIKIKK